jgi:hypothetical protein
MHLFTKRACRRSMRPMPMVRFTHDVTKIAAFRCDQLGETIEDEASFAQIARRAAERLSRLACHGSRYAVLEVGGSAFGRKADAHHSLYCLSLPLLFRKNSLFYV